MFGYTLYFGQDIDDHEAAREVLRTQLPCRLVGPIFDLETPQLAGEDIAPHIGLAEVKAFLDGWEKK